MLGAVLQLFKHNVSDMPRQTASPCSRLLTGNKPPDLCLHGLFISQKPPLHLELSVPGEDPLPLLGELLWLDFKSLRIHFSCLSFLLRLSVLLLGLTFNTAFLFASFHGSFSVNFLLELFSLWEELHWICVCTNSGVWGVEWLVLCMCTE